LFLFFIYCFTPKSGGKVAMYLSLSAPPHQSLLRSYFKMCVFRSTRLKIQNVPIVFCFVLFAYYFGQILQVD